MSTVGDVWAMFGELDGSTQERLADVLETRGRDPRQRQMREAFLAGLELPASAVVLEVGCGTGVLTRMLARLPGTARVTGVDVAPALLDRARDLAAGHAKLAFERADAYALPYADAAYDAVVFDSVLSHLRDPDAAVGEACRVLRPGGRLAVFDGDYATATVALGEHDPLQACVAAMMAASVTDRFVVRGLAGMLARHGLVARGLSGHGYAEAGAGGYLLSVVDRGADLLAGAGTISTGLAAELKAEARRRADRGAFFGHIGYASIVAELSPAR